MPKNNKKMKNAKNVQVNHVRSLILREDGQEYAKVTKMLGNRRVECECFDNKTRLGRIRPTRKANKVGRVNLEDIVLVSLRDFEDDKCDIFLVYNQDDIKKLVKMYEIPDEVVTKNEDDDTFFFGEEEEDKTAVDIETI